jgi:hypothetical protein
LVATLALGTCLPAAPALLPCAPPAPAPAPRPPPPPLGVVDATAMAAWALGVGDVMPLGVVDAMLGPRGLRTWGACVGVGAARLLRVLPGGGWRPCVLRGDSTPAALAGRGRGAMLPLPLPSLELRVDCVRVCGRGGKVRNV